MKKTAEKSALRIVKQAPLANVGKRRDAGLWDEVFAKLSTDTYILVPQPPKYEQAGARHTAIGALGGRLLEVLARPDGLYIRLRGTTR